MKNVKNIFSGIIIGVLLIIGGVFLLFFNESNNVKNIRTVEEARKNVVTVKNDTIDYQNNGKLVSTNGLTTYGNDFLIDNYFQVKSKKTLKLERVVEMYQWQEEADTDDNDQTTYTYTKEWSESEIPSTDFYESGHDNPATMPIQAESFAATDVKLGAYNIEHEDVMKLDASSRLELSKDNLLLTQNYKLQNNYITNSVNLAQPQIGDVRISYYFVPTDEISVLSEQKDNHFVPYKSKDNKNIHVVKSGIYTGEELIDIMEKENNFMKWLLRAIGIFLLMFGFACILSPLSTLVGFIPIIGGHVSGIVNLIGMMIGLMVSFIIIAISWLVVRPLLGIGLLIGAGILFAGVIYIVKKNKNKNKTLEQPNNQVSMMNQNINNNDAPEQVTSQTDINNSTQPTMTNPTDINQNPNNNNGQV